MIKYSFEVSVEQNGCRIDKYLSNELHDHSRAFLQKLIKDSNVIVNDKIIKPNYKLNTNDAITIQIPVSLEPEILAEDIPLDILFEDKDVLIINKPKGMVVHPSAGHYTGTLVNAVMFHCKDNLSGINGVLRPGIVHRIDMDTTGALIVCKNDIAHNSIAFQLKEHSITRKYRAIVHGTIKDDEGIINAPIGRHANERKKMAINEKNGKSAITHYKVLQRSRDTTYIECQLETGRTHQIRVHMSSIHHPLLGDQLYSYSKKYAQLQGQTLHAMVIGFIHPSTKEYMEFTAPLPKYFENLLLSLNYK